MGRGLLIIVSGLFVVYGLIQRALNSRQQTIEQYNTNYAVKTQSELIANTMADAAFAELNTIPPSADSGGLGSLGTFSQRDVLGGKGWVTSSTITPSATNPFLQHKVMHAFGVFDGDTTEIVVTAKRRAFSIYSYFTVVEPTIYFTTGDTLNGPVHTNGEFHVSGDPVFNGNVSSVGGLTGYGDPEFNGDVNDFSADSIDLPIEVPNLAAAASNGGLRFTDPIKIDFFNDNSTGTDVGKASIATGTKVCVRRRWWGCARYETNWSSPTVYNLADYNGIISSSEDVEVKGELNGNVTLHSEKDVRIMGDLWYHDNPENDPNSDDLMGLVSEGDVIVDRNAHEDHGSKDLTIQASIMALGDSFTVEGYNDGERRGQLNLLGGLIQYTRGAVGLVSGSGYKKFYSYDNRFLDQSPKGFPLSDQYEYISWNIVPQNKISMAN